MDIVDTPRTDISNRDICSIVGRNASLTRTISNERRDGILDIQSFRDPDYRLVALRSCRRRWLGASSSWRRTTPRRHPTCPRRARISLRPGLRTFSRRWTDDDRGDELHSTDSLGHPARSVAYTRGGSDADPSAVLTAAYIPRALRDDSRASTRRFGGAVFVDFTTLGSALTVTERRPKHNPSPEGADVPLIRTRAGTST